MAAVLLAALSAGGLLARAFIEARQLGAPWPFGHRIFFFLYEQHEGPFLWVQAIFAVLAIALVARPGLGLRSGGGPLSRPWSLRVVATLGGATLCVAALGTKVVFHDTALTMDELGPEFQAKILAEGRLAAPLPSAWKPFGQALAPVGIAYRAADSTWRSTYLPGYAALRALFLAAGLPAAANPVLSALTVLGVAMTAVRLRPEEPRAGPLALVFLLTSSQFVMNGMAFYSMPAHLCLNVWWLYFHLRADRLGSSLAPLLGGLALLLHNPVPHATFVFPFLVRMVRSRRPFWVLYTAAIYCGAVALALLWYRESSDLTQTADYLKIFSGSSRLGPLVQLMSATLVFTWQSPLLSLAVLLGIAVWRGLAPAERDLAVGIGLALLVHAMFPSHQGHGWGYRYVHGVLGNLVFLGVAGAAALVRSTGAKTLNTLVAAAVALFAVFQLPMRALQAEAFVAPWSQALQLISSLSTGVVVVETSSAWYAQDLVRNDPFLRHEPKVLWRERLSQEQFAALAPLAKGRIAFVGADALARLGLPAWRIAAPPPPVSR